MHCRFGRSSFVIVVSIVQCLISASLAAAEFEVKSVGKAPPGELNPSISSLLQSNALQVVEGGEPVLEIWFRKEIPLKGKPESPAKSMDAIAVPTLIGAVQVLKDRRDYRDDAMPSGVYTMRFALQPQDGNHLGTSDYPTYALLVRANADIKPDAITTDKGLNNASRKDTGSDHPVLVSLRPLEGEPGVTPRIHEPAAEHKSVVVKVPGRILEGGESADLYFEVVVEGKGRS